MQLSTNFTFEEMTESRTADLNNLSNSPGPKERENLKTLCVELLEPIRALLGKPIKVTSGYRSERLNALVGGSKTSQHKLGQAADIQVEGMTTQQLFDTIRASSIEYDQIIQEFNSWVHISYRKGSNRKSALYAKRDGKGKTIYQNA